MTSILGFMLGVESPVTSAAPQTPPGQVQNVHTNPGNTTMTVSWDPTATATDYKITWTPGNGTLDTGFTSSGIVNGLTNGTTYTFTVTASNSAGAGPGSSPVTGTPQVPVGGAVNVVFGYTGASNAITANDYVTLANWGVGTIGGGGSPGPGYLPGFGGNPIFSTFPTLNAAAQTAAGYVANAHAGNIACVLGSLGFLNYGFSPSSGTWAVYTSAVGPCLGSWHPNFLDGAGHGWGGQTVPYTAGSWNLAMYQAGYAIALQNLNGIFWDTEGGEIGPQDTGSIGGCTWTAGSPIVHTTNNFKAVPFLSGTFPLGPSNDISVPGGGSIKSVDSNTQLTMVGNATTTQNAPGATLSFDKGASYITWSWRNFYNGYGATSINLGSGEAPGNRSSFQRYVTTQAQERSFAQQRGFDMITALNRGYHAAQAAGAGNTAIGNNDVPIYLYASAGFSAQFPGSYTDMNSTHQGLMNTEPGQSATVTFHQNLVDNVWQYFIVGCAQATTAKIVCGNAYFYSCGAVINANNLYGTGTTGDGGWAKALTADQTGDPAFTNFATGLSNLHTYTGITTPSNLKVAPMVWLLDSTGGDSPGGPTWTQAQWLQGVGPIVTSVQNSGANAFMIYDQTGFPNAITSTSNYLHNTNANRGGTGQNYTPLNS